jgi:hypothetical protein
MKEFMLIFLGADYSELNMSPEESQEQMNKWFEWVGKLQAQDIYAGGHALIPSAKRLSGPEGVVTDGPFAEAKELVGGYFVVKAKDWDEAVAISKDYPDFHLGGSVEVREIMVFDNE